MNRALGLIFYFSMAALGASICPAAGGPVAATLPAVLAISAASTRPATVPDSAAQRRVRKLIHELFAADYAEKTPAARLSLAKTLLKQADQTSDDSAARFVLLEECRDLAVRAGDAELALSAVDRMGRNYAVDVMKMKLAALADASRAATRPAAARTLAGCALRVAEAACLLDDPDAAARALALAQDAATRAKKVPLVLRVRDRIRELADYRAEHERVIAAFEAIQQDGGNADARTVAGRGACYLRGRWDVGLPMLAAGTDTALAALAKREAAHPTDSNEQRRIGDAWWDIAAGQPRIARIRIESHAAQWYRRALPRLEGLHRLAVEHRLADAGIAIQPAEVAPGLLAGIYAGEHFEHRLEGRFDPQIDFDWGSDPAGKGLPKDDFSIRWTGWIRIGESGQYTFIILANTGARLWIDNKSIIDAPKLSHSRSGAMGIADLSAGLHPIKVEFWDGGGIARMKLHWRTPDAVEARPIPKEVLFHDPAAAPAEMLKK